MLNAFRHHRNSHDIITDGDDGLHMCSTPFGIIGILTCTVRRMKSEIPVLNAFRHHRNSHIFMGMWWCMGLMCSTPFGIIGILTGAWMASTPDGFFVLNAFRHHRNSHSGMPVISLTFFSAQRLSASSEFSRSKCVEVLTWRRVLNAFRHHRNSHSSIPFAAARLLLVLNAFRHHRNSHTAG